MFLIVFDVFFVKFGFLGVEIDIVDMSVIWNYRLVCVVVVVCGGVSFVLFGFIF